MFKKISIIIGILIISIAFVGCAPKGDPSQVLNDYYDDIKNSDAESAYNTLCEVSKKDFDKGDFIKWINTENEVYSLKSAKVTKLDEYKNKEIGGRTYKNAVQFNVTETSHDNYQNKNTNITYKRYVVNDNGQWKVYKEHQDLKEDLAKAMNSLAWMYIDGKGKNRDFNQAASILNEAVKVSPEYTGIYYSLGYVYGALQRYDESIEAVNKYLGNTDDNEEKSDGYNVLGLDYQNKKDYANAKKNFEQAIKLDPNNQYAKTNLQQLNQAEQELDNLFN